MGRHFASPGKRTEFVYGATRKVGKTGNKMPNHNDDPVSIACWLIKEGIDFPFENDELDLIDRISNSEGPISIHDRYEIVILYWQLVGFLRKGK
jgi:hypothetical protein